MTAIHAAIDPVHVRGLTRAEYDHLVAAGHFVGERLELLHGSIVRMSPQGPEHAHVVEDLTERLTNACRPLRVRVQLPLAAGEDSEPEPDFAIVERGRRDMHPSSALLVIEVADSSLARDRAKAGIYARAGVAEYWIINLVDRAIHVHRRPRPEGYDEVRTVTSGTVTSTAVPTAIVSLDLVFGP